MTGTAFDASRIRTQVEQLLTSGRIPGASVGVVHGGRLALAEAFGVADIESTRPTTLDMRHRIGSITKTMTGLCVMALFDEGRLSLDDRLIDRLPDVQFRGPADAVTLRHLMTHTSGIGEHPNVEDFKRGESVLWVEVDKPVPGVLDAYSEGITIEVEPGTKWAYANHGWVLLGEIVSRIEGAPFPEVLRRRIFEPLGMANSDCLDQPSDDLTTGYHRAPGEDARELAKRAGEEIVDQPTVDGINIRGRYMHVKGGAAGAVQSTIGDMSRYATALLSGGSGIVRSATFREMISPQWAPDRRLICMGMPFFVESLFGRQSFNHGGGVLGGWSTMLWVFPDDDLAVITFMNVITDDYDAHDRLLKIVLDAPDWDHTARAVDAGLLASAPGVYEAPPGILTNTRTLQSTGRVQISARDAELWLHARRGPWKTGVRLLPSLDDPAFFAIDRSDARPHHIAIVRNSAGAVTGLRFDRLVEMHRTDQVAHWA